MDGAAPSVALVVLLLVAASCGPAVPVRDASASLAVADRIVAIGHGQDWYAALELVDSRPDVDWNGPNLGPVIISLVSGIDPGSSIASRACLAILDGVTNPKYGPAFNVEEVIVLGSSSQHECWTPLATRSPG